MHAYKTMKLVIVSIVLKRNNLLSYCCHIREFVLYFFYHTGVFKTSEVKDWADVLESQRHDEQCSDKKS